MIKIKAVDIMGENSRHFCNFKKIILRKILYDTEVICYTRIKVTITSMKIRFFNTKTAWKLLWSETIHFWMLKNREFSLDPLFRTFDFSWSLRFKSFKEAGCHTEWHYLTLYITIPINGYNYIHSIDSNL